jgi:hypothetical protein
VTGWPSCDLLNISSLAKIIVHFVDIGGIVLSIHNCSMKPID